MDKIKDFFKNCYSKIEHILGNQETLSEKIFWGVVPLTFGVGIVSVIGTLFEGLGFLAVLSGIMCTIVPVVIAVLCYIDGNKCSTYYAIYCVILNGLLMPLTFLSNGGLRSGMPMYCMGTLILCAFCSTRHQRHLTSMISFFASLIVLIADARVDGLSLSIDESFVETDIILSFAVAAVSMTIVLSRATEEYNKQRFRKVNDGLIDSLGTIIEFRNLETGDHVHNIRRLTSIMLSCANKTIPGVHFTKDEIDMIASASMLHDIGKIAVPDRILQKPGNLTIEEYEIMKRHPIDGCQMIESMKEYQNHQYFEYCYEICRHHHEHYDGSGYPDGLKGDEIPLISQIVALADVYDALVSQRVYKRAYSPQRAADIILRESKGMFSPDILKCFEKARPAFEMTVYLSEKNLSKMK